MKTRMILFALVLCTLISAVLPGYAGAEGNESDCKHEWVKANYINPQTCSICGKTQGEPLLADFDKYGLKVNMELDQEYDYTTNCYNASWAKTTGKAKVTNYKITAESPIAGLDTPEGYEWRSVERTLVFSDSNARMYGFNIGASQDNFYQIKKWDETASDWKTIGDFMYSTHTVSFMGKKYTECLEGGIYVDKGWNNNEYTYIIKEYARVPIGFDGIVLGLYDYSIAWGEGQYIYDIADANTLFFRMTNLEVE